MSSFMRVIHLAQALLSGYGAFHSYKAIVNLQTYEATTKKLAKWSDEVGKQLHKTRTTQATAALTILFSTLTSLTLGIKPEIFPSSVLYAAPPCLVIVVLLARSHVSNHWAPSDGKTVGVKVPLPNLDEYNKAQRATEEVLKVLQWVEWSWVGASLGAGMVGY